MTLTVRSATVSGATTKGSALTHAELDENFNHLSQSSNHTFTPSGSGAVARAVQAVLREKWVSAADFGLSVSASAATNTAAIIAAAAEAANHGDAGGVVYIPGNSSAYSCEPLDFDALTERVQLRGDSMRASRLSISGGSTGAGTAAITFDIAGDVSWAGIRDLYINAAAAYERVVYVNGPSNNFKLQGALLNGNDVCDYGLYAEAGSAVHLDDVYTTGLLKRNYFSKNQSSSTQWSVFGGNHDVGDEGIMYVESTTQGPMIYLYGGRYENCTNKDLFQFDSTGAQLRIFGSMFTSGAAASLVRRGAQNRPIFRLDVQLTDEPTNIYTDSVGTETIAYAASSGNNNAIINGPGTRVLLPASGTAALPSIAFAGDDDCGFWRASANQIRFQDIIAFDGANNALRLGSTQYLGWVDTSALTSATLNSVRLYRDANDTLAQRRDGNAQVFNHYGSWTSASRYSRLAIKHATTTVTAAAGATVTATSLIPAKANVLGVNTIVTTALGTGSGTTGYTVGDGTDADRWGAVTGTAIGTDTDGNDATADPTGWFTAANNIVITAAGGNFDGTGAIFIDVTYTITEAD
jgi:hypothetical protein